MLTLCAIKHVGYEKCLSRTHDIGSHARYNIKQCSSHIYIMKEVDGHQPGAQMVVKHWV